MFNFPTNIGVPGFRVGVPDDVPGFRVGPTGDATDQPGFLLVGQPVAGLDDKGLPAFVTPRLKEGNRTTTPDGRSAD